jgi:hypothetical protein
VNRLDLLDRRARYSLGGAVAFVGVLLLVLGWYLISGQVLAAKQLPYLASASLPGAALLACGTVVMLTGPDVGTARRIAELHALLTEAVAESRSDSDTDPETAPGTDPIGESPAESDG